MPPQNNVDPSRDPRVKRVELAREHREVKISYKGQYGTGPTSTRDREAACDSYHELGKGLVQIRPDAPPQEPKAPAGDSLVRLDRLYCHEIDWDESLLLNYNRDRDIWIFGPNVDMESMVVAASAFRCVKNAVLSGRFVFMYSEEPCYKDIMFRLEDKKDEKVMKFRANPVCRRYSKQDNLKEKDMDELVQKLTRLFERQRIVQQQENEQRKGQREKEQREKEQREKEQREKEQCEKEQREKERKLVWRPAPVAKMARDPPTKAVQSFDTQDEMMLDPSADNAESSDAEEGMVLDSPTSDTRSSDTPDEDVVFEDVSEALDEVNKEAEDASAPHHTPPTQSPSSLQGAKLISHSLESTLPSSTVISHTNVTQPSSSHLTPREFFSSQPAFASSLSSQTSNYNASRSEADLSEIQIVLETQDLGKLALPEGDTITVASRPKKLRKSHSLAAVEAEDDEEEMEPIKLGDLVIRIRRANKFDDPNLGVDSFDIWDGPWRVEKFAGEKASQKLKAHNAKQTRSSQSLTTTPHVAKLAFPQGSNATALVDVKYLRKAFELPAGTSDDEFEQLPAGTQRKLYNQAIAIEKSHDPAVKKGPTWAARLQNGAFVAFEPVSAKSIDDEGSFEIGHLRAKRVMLYDSRKYPDERVKDAEVIQWRKENPRIKKGKIAIVEYLVHWAGWASEDDTWEPAHEIPADVIAVFEDARTKPTIFPYVKK